MFSAREETAAFARSPHVRNGIHHAIETRIRSPCKQEVAFVGAPCAGGIVAFGGRVGQYAAQICAVSADFPHFISRAIEIGNCKAKFCTVTGPDQRIRRIRRKLLKFFRVGAIGADSQEAIALDDRDGIADRRPHSFSGGYISQSVRNSTVRGPHPHWNFFVLVIDRPDQKLRAIR